MGMEGENPAQIGWHIGVQKKWYKLSKLGGRGGWGGRGNLDKIKKNSYFFLEAFPRSTFGADKITTIASGSLKNKQMKIGK